MILIVDNVLGVNNDHVNIFASFRNFYFIIKNKITGFFVCVFENIFFINRYQVFRFGCK